MRLILASQMLQSHPKVSSWKTWTSAAITKSTMGMKAWAVVCIQNLLYLCYSSVCPGNIFVVVDKLFLVVYGCINHEK